MQLHVAFLPSLVTRPQVCIVIDVIRASTTLVTLVERGAGPILIAPDVETARRHARVRPGAVLAGEEDGLAPAGFDFGNSPVELARAELGGKTVIFATTNGTAAIRAVQGAMAVFIGALRNGGAVSAEAVELAHRQEVNLTVVCAGRVGAFGIDDAYCAGYLVDRVLQGKNLELTDAAEAALRLYRSEPDSVAVFRRSAAGRNVIELGLGGDVDYCATRDVSAVVPRLGREIRLLESG
jgi:2-phosphosulfolactate phosphatase